MSTLFSVMTAMTRLSYLVFFIFGVVQGVHAENRILASIKPLALIAQEIAGNDIAVDTLLPNAASPHDYPLKMSDHRRLREATLVLWIGPELESFLDKPIRNLPIGRSISAYDLPEIHWPNEAEETDHHHDGHDPHLWLNPQNAVVIAKTLAKRLSEMEPGKSSIFISRAEAFSSAMKVFDGELEAQMEPLKNRGFAVYHEGYAHFVRRYELNQLGYVTYMPERRPGARHIHELHQVVKEKGVCLFTEPYQASTYVKELAKELDLRLGYVDPIGDNQVKSYRELLEKMGQAFSACLTH